MLVEMRSVDVRRGRRTVVEGVELTVLAGEVVHVAGANGSGKTSLLRTVAGLAPARRGTVRLGGACAFVPEKVQLAPALRCAEWLTAMRRLRRDPPLDWSVAAAAAGLDPAVLHRPSATLSKGMLQRVALLDALHASAPVLLLDEPFSGLDAPARDWLAVGMRARLAQDGAVLLTDHDGAMDGRLPAAAVLRLAEGTAHRDAPPPDPHATAATSVGLLATHPDGRRVEERLAPDAVDARLLALLDDGWHIERVAP